jgi:hypothetical protein
MRTRTGKIARLSKKIREELNARLENGEQGRELVEWLNRMPEVKKMLAEQFGGNPITENNLSDWKEGGYQDWLKQTEACDLVRSLAENGDELGKVADGKAIGDRLANVLVVELARVIQMSLTEEGSAEERWSRLEKLLQAVSRLRRDDHAATRTAIKQKRSDLDYLLTLQRARKEDSSFG